MIKTILIVDDSPIARKMLKASIPKDRGYEIHEAKDGREGIEKYQEVNPDVTFLDLTMPVMDGYQAIPEIKRLDASAIIIVVTADIQAKSISNVMELGAFTLLRKPAQAKSIQETLAKAEKRLEKMLEKADGAPSE